jgi:hypothetical protein
MSRTALARQGASAGILARRPLTSFFLIAFGMSWLVWAPLELSKNRAGAASPYLGCSSGSDRLRALRFWAGSGVSGICHFSSIRPGTPLMTTLATLRSSLPRQLRQR